MSIVPIKSNHRITSNLSQERELYIIISLMVTVILEMISLHPVMPAIAKHFNVPPEQIGLIMTTFLIPVAIGNPIFGVLADRVGRKQILIPSLLLFALGGTLSAFAPDFRSLLEWRFVQGIGVASIESLALALIGDLYSGKMLTAAMGLNASIIGITATVAPLIGGGLAQLSWRYPFLLSLCAIPVALLALTKLKLPHKQNSASNFQLKTYVKTVWSGIKNRQILGLMFAVFSLFTLELGACFTAIPILAANSFGASSAVIGIILASLQLSFAFFASQLKWLVHKFEEITLIKVSFLIGALGLLTTPFVHNVWLLLVPAISFGAALGIAVPSIQTTFARLAPEGKLAGFMALNVMVQSLGRAVGPAIAGIAIGFWGIQGVFYACAGLAFVTVVLLNPLLSFKK